MMRDICWNLESETTVSSSSTLLLQKIPVTLTIWHSAATTLTLLWDAVGTPIPPLVLCLISDQDLIAYSANKIILVISQFVIVISTMLSVSHRVLSVS